MTNRKPWYSLANGRLKLLAAFITVFVGGGLGVKVAGDLMWLHEYRLSTPAIIRQYQEERPVILEQLRIMREGQQNLVTSLDRLSDEIRQEREARIREEGRRAPH